MSTRVFAAPISLDVRAMMIGGGGGGGLSRVSPNDACLSRVKRCLFGGPRSPQEALQQAQLVANELQRHQDADCKRWNFDFVREEPLSANGRFTWTPCDAAPPSNRPSNQPTNVLRQSQITGNCNFSPVSKYFQILENVSKSVPDGCLDLSIFQTLFFFF